MSEEELDPMNFRVEKNVRVPMRDGVELSADLWLPDSGPSPALLVRTPYGKETLIGGSYSYPLHPDPFTLLGAGYAVVWQDARGCSLSDGDFVPMVHEERDGADTVAWIARQEWCNGSVGAYGASYMGFTQLAAAVQSPPALKAITPAATSSDYYRAPWYSAGGAMSWRRLQNWVSRMAVADVRRDVARGGPGSELLPRLTAAMNDPRGFEMTAPDLREVVGTVRWAGDWLAHPDRDEYWSGLSIVDRAESVIVPALHVVGWFDFLVDATIASYRALRSRAGTPDARAGQRLVIGPWDHITSDAAYPARPFPATASAIAAQLTDTYLDFYDCWLRGKPQKPRDRAPVRIFVMGIDEWRDEPDWPLPDTRYVDYFLGRGRGANPAPGDGVLSTEVPAEDGADTYVYDPNDPAPAIGGRTELPGLGIAAGPADQSAVERRADVLCFTSDVLTEPLEVTGHITLIAHASSSAPDTDFTGKLVDVHPDGRALYLCDGILRARYRDSCGAPEPLVPGEVYRLTIDLSVTSNVFLPGHRVRLEVSSSCFPRYDRNTNTGGVIARETMSDARTAVNSVRHGPSYPSRLILPVISR